MQVERRTPSGRISQARRYYPWVSVLNRIAEVPGRWCEVQRPFHLTIYQTRDKVLEVCEQRKMQVDYIIILGHLYVWMVV